ncbi:MAG: hypothetical protein A4E69_02343 [Syntrophus sp. PtaB.Bin138]|jgi:hypothetical protein|uniref:DUF721 domain-containing protein n=1 Tax=Syntrophus sp. (in: bacteria) TaxID=48412 RepID=UPI0009CCBDEE|nr:MAG: hypothetical protein A4E69_02343 [Syntrophus sp. PtaB.Bin138]
MRRRAAQKKMEPLGPVLQKALKRRHVPFDLEEKRILALWDQAVGPQIAAQTRPSRIRARTLFVAVSTSVWMQQLHFLKENIIRQFNSLAQKEEIRNIFFSLGRVDARPATSSAPPPSSASEASRSLKKRDLQMIADCTKHIADEELREIVKRVMTKEISRRRLSETG